MVRRPGSGGGSHVNIAVVGCGQVGTVTAACFAAVGHRVYGLEIDRQRAQQLSSGEVGFHEPGLSERCREGIQHGRLSFTTQPSEGIAPAELVFLSVGTPSSPTGQPHVSELHAAAAAIGPHLRSNAVVVTKSTVPVGSGDWLLTEFEGSAPGSWGRSIVANPEFLREGSAVDDFLQPDRIVLGGDTLAIERAERAFAPILEAPRLDG